MACSPIYFHFDGHLHITIMSVLTQTPVGLINTDIGVMGRSLSRRFIPGTDEAYTEQTSSFMAVLAYHPYAPIVSLPLPWFISLFFSRDPNSILKHYRPVHSLTTKMHSHHSSEQFLGWGGTVQPFHLTATAAFRGR